MEREAKTAAAKVVGRAHGAIVAATVGLITIVLVTTSLVRMGWHWFASALPPLDEIASLSSAMPLTVIALVGVVILVFTPVAVYLALADE